MVSLKELARDFDTDKGTVHTYLEAYEELLAPYRETSRNVLELGVLAGESIRLWEAYFAQAKVQGIDISLTPLDIYDLRPLIAAGHHIHIGDATDPSVVENLLGGQVFDVVIDDASHAPTHQVINYENFRARMAPDGIYIIEDVADIEQQLPSFQEMAKGLPLRVLDRRHLIGRFDDVLVIIGGTRK